jgi:uncharacterized protein DUF3455
MTRTTIITRSALAAVSAGVLASAVALVGTSSSQAADDSARPDAARSGSIPAALTVPAGNVQTSVFAAQGVQVYRCTAGAWGFVEPAATLTGKSSLAPRSYQTAVHFRGPSWASTTDGSLVTATAAAASPVDGSIPQLLLKAATNRGDGSFGKVSYIQRLETSGGAAPAGSCTDGNTTGVPYQAKYRFCSPAG